MTESIQIVNNVNTSVVGSYTVTYDVNDAAGNAATQVVRTVRVADGVRELTLNMLDAFGDGWSGSYISIKVNGIEVLYATLADGYTRSETFIAFPGDEVSYSFPTEGSFASEITWNITDSDGNERASGGTNSNSSFIA